MRGDSGVSEIVGTILLVSIVVLGVSIISVAILSQPLPEEIPQVTANVYNNSTTVYFVHTGGDSIKKAELTIRVTGAHEEEFRDSQIIGNNTWSLGDALYVNYTSTGAADMPEVASVIYTGGSTSTLILRANLISGEITGGGTPPTTLPTATTAATLATTIPTTPAPPSISGMKWNDLYNNGIKEAGEPGLPGWIIYLYRKQGSDYIFDRQTTTDSSGNYAFSSLKTGEKYRVCEQLQPGWTQTYPSGDGCHSELHITGSSVTFSNKDFGNRQ